MDKEKKAQYNKTYKLKHKEEISKYNKEYRENYSHKILSSEHNKIYRIANREKDLERKRIYRANNDDSIRAYREANKEKAKGYTNKYNKTKHNINTQKRRTRKLLLIATLTDTQWSQIKNSFNNKCAYCGKELPLAQEHFIPLSKGGEYTLNNIIPSCKHCNSSKCDRDFFSWYLKYEYYSKERETKILKYLHYENNNQQLALTF